MLGSEFWDGSKAIMLLPFFTIFLDILGINIHESEKFWSLRDDNRLHRSVGSEVPIKPYMFDVEPLVCWAYVGSMLGLCVAHVGPMLGHVEPKLEDLADFRSLEKS